MSRFRFGLKLILLMMIPLGAVAYWAAPWINDRPIEWVDFSEERLNQELDDGKTVVVFAGADWDFTAAVIRKSSFGRKARRLINQETFVAMIFDISSSHPLEKEYQLLNPRKGNDSSYFYASVFSPQSREPPIVFRGLFTEDELVEVLKKQSAQPSINHSK